jgi:hypothetical protein
MKTYLCRVPQTGQVIVLREPEYKFIRHHEESLCAPDPDYNMVLLATGTEKDMRMYRKSFMEELTNVS